MCDVGYKVDWVVIIVDREEGGDVVMMVENFELISLYKLFEIVVFMLV